MAKDGVLTRGAKNAVHGGEEVCGRNAAELLAADFQYQAWAMKNGAVAIRI